MADTKEQIFDANATKYMSRWNFIGFQKTHPQLYYAILASMHDYGKQKWEEACNETWQAVNEAMGDQSVEDSLNLVNVIHPEFKP